MKAISEAVYAVAITLWIGGLWTVGGIVAPVLFSTLTDRMLAGGLAARLFSLISYVGIGCAIYLLLFRVVRFGGACLKQGVFWVLLIMLGLTLVGEFGVQPMLASLKNRALPREVMESVFRDRFTTWHGIASILYLVESALGAILVWLHARLR